MNEDEKEDKEIEEGRCKICGKDPGEDNLCQKCRCCSNCCNCGE